METRPLGNTDIQVSLIGLGTMTWGEQNTEQEAHEQLDYATSCGINFIDTAEMYPVPPRAATYGRTEEYIGRWFRRRRNRDRIVLATKVASRSDGLGYIRNGDLKLDRKHITRALDDSLRRLQTDYIDLYQLHWPERTTNFFGKPGYHHVADESPTPLHETLGVMADLVASGKIRHVGISNETPWGTMTYLKLSEAGGLPRVVTVQNPYSLLNRSFEIGMAEIAHREQIGLLAYSPLGFGVLSGKYSKGNRPAGSRLVRFDSFTRYSNDEAMAATDAYVALARRYHLDPAQMALAFVHSRPFVTSTLIGATTMAQLQADIASASVRLPPELLAEVDAIHKRFPIPSP